MSTEVPGGPGDRMTRGTVMALVAMSLAVFVVANDFTALSVALPTIERQFNADVSTVQWVINAYALVFGVLIVTGGRLADMFGRKRMFFVGAGIFAVFSVLGGLAPDVGWLIAARALMGIGGALMWPATLGMTYALLPESKAGLAGGLIVGVAGIGNAVGPLIGGALTDLASWRWVLLINLPIAAIACFVTWREVRRPRGRLERGRIDYWGITTLSLGLTALLVALDQGGDWGFGDPANHRAVRRIRGVAARIPVDRTSDGRRRADASGTLAPPAVRGLLRRRATARNGLLRAAALHAAVHAEVARLLAAAGRGRVATDDGRVRRRLVRGGHAAYHRLGPRLSTWAGRHS